jgi:hypothetical protein
MVRVRTFPKGAISRRFGLPLRGTRHIEIETGSVTKSRDDLHAKGAFL